MFCSISILPAGADAAPANQPSPRYSYRAHAGLLHTVSARMVPTRRYASGHGLHTALYRGGRRTVQFRGISCVPYAREVSGIRVIGNAWQWWHNAAGVYARGDRPEIGSVLNFRANPRMPLGHVAVVEAIVNAREIRVEHANWPSFGIPGQIMRDVTVVDVSEANNWSAVRVELGRGADFGSVYPTYGFIYNRPDTGVITASIAPPAPQPDINPVPSDLRPKAERPWRTVEEVAELPAARTETKPIDLRIIPASAVR